MVVMKSKTYINITLSIILAGLLLVTGLQIAIDPLFQYHTPWGGMKPVLTDERYQYAGLAKNFSYDNVILGNSFCENFKASSFTEINEGETIKLAISGSSPEDWKKIVSIIKDKNVKRVIFNIDPYTLLTPKPENDSLLKPLEYLYDNHIINDVNYLYNFGTLQMSIDSVIKNTTNSVPDFDIAFLEYGKGKDEVIRIYNNKRTDYADEEPSVQEALSIANWNLDFISSCISEMPNTEFVIFFTPVSVLYWDKVLRDRNDKCWENVYYLCCERLIPIKNVKLFLWSDDAMLSLMSDIDNYKDEAHYTPEVCDLLAKRIGQNEGVVLGDDYSERIDKLFKYIYSFDYDSLLG